jgi:hypothetical protein
MNNFKGIYYDNESDKYICPVTGAHFNFKAVTKTLEQIRLQRGDPKCKQLKELVPAVEEIINSAHEEDCTHGESSFIKQPEGEVTYDRSQRMSENFGEDSMDE